MIKQFVSWTRKMDGFAYDFFSGLSAYSKSLVVSGLISSIIIAVCAALAAFYIAFNGFSAEIKDIIEMLIDRSAALPAISVFFCIISEIILKQQ